MQAIVKGLLTTYSSWGEGKLVLGLHGWGDQAKGFAQLQARLAKKYKVVVPDLPGFGGTQAPPTAWGLSDYAEFITSFLQKLQLPQPYAVIGHSNGGAIAIRALANEEFKANKLILLASAGVRGEYAGRNKALRLITKAGKAFTYPLPKSAKQKLRHKVYQTIGSDMLVAEHLQGTFKKIITDDVRSDARRLDLPTLLIYGENDDQTPVAMGETFHQLIPNSTLEILPEAGHFVHVDRPDEVIKSVEAFLK